MRSGEMSAAVKHERADVRTNVSFRSGGTNRFENAIRLSRENFPLANAPRNVQRAFAIAGARLVAARYCGRISLVVALSWIGARGSLAVPGSMVKV
jgi:hypothetical protein